MSIFINFFQIDSPESTLFTGSPLKGAKLISDTGHIVAKFRVKIKSVGLIPKSYTYISNSQYMHTTQKAIEAGMDY